MILLTQSLLYLIYLSKIYFILLIKDFIYFTVILKNACIHSKKHFVFVLKTVLVKIFVLNF